MCLSKTQRVVLALIGAAGWSNVLAASAVLFLTNGGTVNVEPGAQRATVGPVYWRQGVTSLYEVKPIGRLNRYAAKSDYVVFVLRGKALDVETRVDFESTPQDLINVYVSPLSDDVVVTAVQPDDDRQVAKRYRKDGGAMALNLPCNASNKASHLIDHRFVCVEGTSSNEHVILFDLNKHEVVASVPFLQIGQISKIGSDVVAIAGAGGKVLLSTRKQMADGNGKRKPRRGAVYDVTRQQLISVLDIPDGDVVMSPLGDAILVDAMVYTPIGPNTITAHRLGVVHIYDANHGAKTSSVISNAQRFSYGFSQDARSFYIAEDGRLRKLRLSDGYTIVDIQESFLKNIAPLMSIAVVATIEIETQ